MTAKCGAPSLRTPCPTARSTADGLCCNTAVSFPSPSMATDWQHILQGSGGTDTWVPAPEKARVFWFLQRKQPQTVRNMQQVCSQPQGTW